MTVLTLTLFLGFGFLASLESSMSDFVNRLKLEVGGSLSLLRACQLSKLFFEKRGVLE